MPWVKGFDDLMNRALRRSVKVIGVGVATPSQDATPAVTSDPGFDNRSRDCPDFLEEEEPWTR